MTKQAITVNGMSCGHCVETINKAVGALPGVQAVSVELEQKRVSVEYDAAATGLEEISDAIAKAGFEVEGQG